MRGLLVVCVVAGCAKSSTVECGDGHVCPAGTRCIAMDAGGFACASTDQVSACAGLEDLAYCVEPSANDIGSRCYSGACFPIVCGDGFTDPLEACKTIVEPGRECCCGNGAIEPAEGEVCDDGNFVGHDGCHACELEQPVWTPPLLTSSPDARQRTAMAYDIARQRIVLYGGIDGQFRHKSDTFELDRALWIHASPSLSPGRRSDHAMAYDAARRRIVMFGGNSGTFAGDTWEYDGASWIPFATATAPTARSTPAMAYDSIRKKTVLFGGDDKASSYPDDTWTWDGTAWEQQSPSVRPPGRYFHGMAFDPSRGVIVMTGGRAPAALRDTWEYDGTTWRQIAVPPTADVPEDWVLLTYDPVRRTILGFGGDGSGPLIEPSNATWTWDGQTWTRLVLANRPPSRVGPALASNPITAKVILFGGCSDANCGAPLADHWEWDGASWSQMVPALEAAPPPRSGVTAAYDVARGRAILFGGVSSTATTDQTYEFDGRSWFAPTPASRPPARSNAAMAYDAAREETIMFGGASSPQVTDDTWRWDGTSWMQLVPATSPSRRHSHAMSFDVKRRRIVLFGGGQPRVLPPDPPLPPLDDTWEWDGATWLERGVAARPSGRINHAMAYDPLSGSTVLFGGFETAANRLAGDTWLWSGEAWSQVQVSKGPLPRSHAAMYWDGNRRRLVLFGGTSEVGALNDLHEWDGKEWKLVVPAASPNSRAGHAMFPAPGHGMYVFGGFDASLTLNDLWLLRWQRPVAYEACHDESDLDDDGRATCADDDCWATCRPMSPPGVAFDPAFHHCGDGVCDPTFEACRSCRADCGCAPICGDFRCDAGETAATCPGDC